MVLTYYVKRGKHLCPTVTSLAINVQEEANKMRKSSTSNKISVRLDSEAVKKLQESKDKGYTTSQYINDLIKKKTVVDLGQYRKLIPHLCELESLLEHEEDTKLKNFMRGEVNNLWQCLKSFQENT